MMTSPWVRLARARRAPRRGRPRCRRLRASRPAAPSGRRRPRRSRSVRRGSVRCVVRRSRAGRRRVERQPRRRRIGGEGAHGLEPADLERAEALAQRRFERRLPAGLDVQPRPQALQRIEAVAGEPGLELAFGLHLLLQRAQRRRGGRRGRPACRSRRWPRPALRGARRRAPAPLAELVQRAPRRACALGFGRAAGAAQARRAVGVGRGQRLLLGREAFAPRRSSWRGCSSMLRLSAASTWICCCTPPTMRALLVARGLRRAQRVFERRQSASPCSSALRRERVALRRRPRRSARRCCSSSACACGLALGPLRVLRAQLGEALLDAAARPSTT